MGIKRYFEDLNALFFPNTCAGCDTPLAYEEQVICTTCRYHLPYTNMHHDLDNKAARQLLGLTRLEAVTSYLYFLDSSRVQQLMHHFKYRGRTEIGVLLGSMYGEILRSVSPFNEIDFIVPMPLHPAKLRKRGYNQSSFFAKGLSLTMQKPVLERVVVRRKSTESQTQKSRYERYENMKGAFAVISPERIADKHVLLVDDVLTTGATMEACAQVILENGNARISAVTIAKAQ